MRKFTPIAIVIAVGLVISFSSIYELTTSPSSTRPLTESPIVTSPLTGLAGLEIEILDPPTRAAPGEELLLRVRVYKPDSIALPSGQLYAYLYAYQLGLGGCLNAGPGDWRDWVVNRIDIVNIDPAYRSEEAHESIFELKLKVKENALAYLDIAGVSKVSLRARLRVPCRFGLDENGESINVTVEAQIDGTVREHTFAMPLMGKRVYTSETKYYLREQGANPSLNLSSKGRIDCDFTVGDFLIGEALEPESAPAILPELSELKVELLNAPTGVMPGEEFSLRVRVYKPEGMVLPNAQLYAYLYCPRLGLQGCLNSPPEGFIDWTANAINITARDPDFRRMKSHERIFGLRIKVKENALEYLKLQGANYVRLRARLRIPVVYSSLQQGLSIQIGTQSFITPVLVEKHYEGETQYYLSNEVEVGNDIHVGSRGNLDYDATVTVVLSEGEQLTRAERALQYVSRAYSIPQARLIPGNEQHGEFRTLGLEFWRVGVLDPVTGESYDIYTDSTGNILSGRELREREKDEAWRKYGKLSRDLHERLENTIINEKVKVGIWLANVDARIPRPRPDEVITKEVEEMIAAARENFERAIELREKPVIDYLRAGGFEVTFASRYVPLIFAELPKQAILELEKRQDVVGIYRSITYAPAIDTAAKTVRAPEVWDRGITGSGVKVAIVEDGAIDFYYNPYLTLGEAYAPGLNITNHATAVAGIVASTCDNFPSNGKDYRGIAFGVPSLLSASARSLDDDDIIDAIEWALSRGANILNNSYGKDTNLEMRLLDRYLDYVVETHYKTVIVSAGNWDLWDNPYLNVVSPGLGYNVISVGAFNDNDTQDWSDDKMWPYSCYNDPSNAWGKREKPEVVAVGSGRVVAGYYTGMYSTIDREPWIDNNFDPLPIMGTSFSAPAVAGEAALLMERADWLKYNPEAVKAVIMASAVHNIENESRLSDKDGAGAIDSLAADWIVQKGWLDTRTISDPDNWDNWNLEFWASSGERVRVVLCWKSYTWDGSPPANDEPKADFNLYVYDSRGGHITHDDARGRTFQIVEFTAPYTGHYKAKVTIERFDGDWEDLALAYCRPDVIS